MRGKFISGILTGSIIGATASMVAMTNMSTRQRRRIVKVGKKAMNNMISGIGMF